MVSRKKHKRRIRERQAEFDERFMVAARNLASHKFPTANGDEPKAFHLYFRRIESPGHERRDELLAAGIHFFLRDIDRDDTAYEETDMLGVEGIPSLAVCVGEELLIEPQDRKGPPVAAVARLQAQAFFHEGLKRWCVLREAALREGFAQGVPMDWSQEDPDDYVPDDVDPDDLYSTLYKFSRLQDLKNLLDATGLYAPSLKADRVAVVVEAFEDGTLSGMDIARHLPRQFVDPILMMHNPSSIVGNLNKVRQRLARLLEGHYRVNKGRRR